MVNWCIELTYLAVFGSLVRDETNNNEGDNRDTSEYTKTDGQDG